MSGSKLKQAVYLTLAVIGMVWTWYFNLQLEGGFAGFFTGMFNTPISGSLAADVTIALLTWLVWMIPEARRLGMANRTIALLIVLSFAIAFAFTFPLFMYLRERAMEREAG